MRKLILLRGGAGSGKTHFLSQAGLSMHALSMDHLRLTLGAPVLDAHGEMAISQELNSRAFKMFRDLAFERMSRGELLALDGTFTDVSNLKMFVAMAQQMRYEVACVDFSTVPADTVRRQNLSRGDERVVPAPILDKQLHNLSQNPAARIPALNDAKVIMWDASGSHVQAVKDWLKVPVRDFSSYGKIVHIGDLQGCLTPLTGPGGVLEHGFDPKSLYVFIGDLFDRGLQNGEVGRWFVDQALPLDNVLLLWGNHELHLHLWARGEPAVSSEFEHKTLPQLKAHGVTREDAERICQKAQEAILYSYHGHKVLATHGGLSSVPAELARVSLRQLSHGTGKWHDPVDEQFERQAQEGWVQVHGHRNHAHQAAQATARSFNLEDAVEYGGNLRSATLTPAGWTTMETRNDLFTSARERGRDFNEDLTPAWMAQPQNVALSHAAMEALRAHPFVYVNNSQSKPHIVSFDFGERVFFDKSWDDVVVKARGLFVNEKTCEIVARGYDKFFNVNEKGRDETQMEELLSKTLQFPITLYVKENGFLGNIGFDAQTQELVISSKTSTDGPMALVFQDVFNALVPATTREGIRRYLRDNEACAVFEVIDPVRDPHLIDYDAPQLVLLDIFQRSETVAKLPHDQLKAVAHHFGLTAKEKALHFKTAQEFRDWHHRATADLSYRWRGRDIEGFVVEDANGFLTKVKLPHYSFWKTMRSAAERMPKIKASIAEARSQVPHSPQLLAAAEEKLRRALQKDAHPLARSFLAWAHSLSDADVQLDILSLRKRFIAEEGLPQNALAIKWERFDREAMSKKTRPLAAPAQPESNDQGSPAQPRRKPSL